MIIRAGKMFASLCAGVTLLALTGCPGFFTPRADNPGSTARYAYVANFQQGNSGSISIFTVDTTSGALTNSGSAVSTGSTSLTNGPAALAIVLGKFLYSANDGGSVSGFAINTSTGTLTTIAGTPIAAGANPNSIVADPTGKFLYVANSGSHDVSAYSINASTGALTSIATLPAGSSSGTAGQAVGLAMHPTGKFLFVALDTAGIALFSLDTSTGLPTFVSTFLPQSGGQPQSLVIEKTGTYLYSADIANGVEEFSINATTGGLTSLAGSPATAGTIPIVLTADASGSHVYVANQGSGNVSSFGILTNGTLAPISGGLVAAGSSPAAIAIEPSGKFVYVTNFSSGPDVSVYSIDSTGKLVASSTASTGVVLANAAAIAFL